MSQQTINTVIVLRNDQTTNWENSEYKLLKGEVGIGYLENGNVIAKLGVDGQTAWKDLPQIEGVFEEELTLTHDFGRYQTANGFVKTTDAKGMTTSQWLIHALSETKDPEVIEPTFGLTASAGAAEIGSYITTLNWTASTGYGSYEYGPATNLSYANRKWEITNSFDEQSVIVAKGTADTTAASINNNNTGSYAGSFTLTGGIQLDQEAKKEYATITGTYELDASSATTPLNNIGVGVESKKITSKSGSLTATVETTAYRKPFWGVLPAGSALDITKLTSAAIRGLSKSGTATKGLPSGTGKLAVPVGSQMVIFAAKAGTYKTLTATDDKAMNATVTFEKVANAVKVEGANGFEAVNYDIWYVDWKAGIGSEKLLTLKWT